MDPITKQNDRRNSVLFYSTIYYILGITLLVVYEVYTAVVVACCVIAAGLRAPRAYHLAIN